MIKQMIELHDADPEYLNEYLPRYDKVLASGAELKLNDFIDIMTALRCEVMVVPLGKNTPAWFRLNDFPDKDGNVLTMPDKILDNRYLKWRRSVYERYE